MKLSDIQVLKEETLLETHEIPGVRLYASTDGNLVVKLPNGSNDIIVNSNLMIEFSKSGRAYIKPGNDVITASNGTFKVHGDNLIEKTEFQKLSQNSTDTNKIDTKKVDPWAAKAAKNAASNASIGTVKGYFN